jgi:uncharacterized protein (DUF4415 family)
MVRHEQDKLPVLTKLRLKELKALAQQIDAHIDYSDIPPLTDDFWRSVVRNPFYCPSKTHATVCIDADVLAWLKQQGRGYQTRLNAILRQAMLEDARKV